MSDSGPKPTSLPITPVLVFIVFQAFILLTWAPLERGEFKEGLTAMGVIALPVPYGDFLTISSGVQFYERGGDPYTEGEYDFIGRKFNYPPIWLKMSFLGMSPEEVRYVYIVFATLFSIALALLFYNQSGAIWLLGIPFVFSPPVFLALERCNNDLFMFFLIVSGIWIIGRRLGKFWDWLGAALVLAATVLKVFPVFAFYVFLRDGWKKSLTFLVPFGLVCAIYFAAVKSILSSIHENTPWSAVLSFGLNVVPYYLTLKLPESPLFQGPYFLMIAWIVACSFILIGYSLGRRGFESQPEDNGFDTQLFKAGGAIYIAAYFMGSNYDYRLIFLLLTLPFAFRMLKSQGSDRNWFAMYLVTLGAVFWINHGYGEAYLLVNEGANWILFFLSITFQFRILPGFLRKLIYKPAVGS